MSATNSNVNALITQLFASLGRASPPVNHHSPHGSGEPPQIATLPSSRAAAALEDPKLKRILITLHCLFPHSFLPALDLIDRGLVTRVAPAESSADAAPRSQQDELQGFSSGGDPVGETSSLVNGGRVYYVRSAHNQQQQRGRRRPGEPSSSAAHFRDDGDDDAAAAAVAYYEVRLGAWNCSCAAFAFSSLAGTEAAAAPGQSGSAPQAPGLPRGDERSHLRGGGQQRAALSAERLEFGGVRAEAPVVPVCKHILACYLMEAWPAARESSAELVEGSDDAVGWVAGWR